MRISTRLVAAAADAYGLEIALDFAIQCSLDHPWIKAHPEWFEWRPDGTLKYAENPPKKYEDITNVHFYGAGPAVALVSRCATCVLFWAEHGVKRIFRVDNPPQRLPVLGMADRARSTARTRTRSSSPRPSPGRR